MRKNIYWWAAKLKFPGLMVMLGGVLILYGHHLIKQSLDSSSWFTTPGVVVVSQLETSSWRSNTPSIHSRESQETEARYSARICYEYYVYGQLYTGSNIRLVMPLHRTRSGVQPLLKRYPVGQQVTVHFDPDKPQTSVLETEVDENSYILFYAGIMWSSVWAMVLIVAAIVVYYKQLRC